MTSLSTVPHSICVQGEITGKYHIHKGLQSSDVGGDIHVHVFTNNLGALILCLKAITLEIICDHHPCLTVISVLDIIFMKNLSKL